MRARQYVTRVVLLGNEGRTSYSSVELFGHAPGAVMKR